MVDKHREQAAQPLELTPQLLLAAYCQGMFPMARSRSAGAVDWFSPNPRAVLPLDQFRCPRSVRQKIRRGTFEIRHDTAFERVVRRCSEPRPGHPETWINDQIIDAYTKLHRLGHAHCVEAWRDDKLVGGLYGVTVGSAFCGESMFCDPPRGGTDASKVCLAHLVKHLNQRGFTLLDVQINSDHMAQFGTIDIPRHRYLHQLNQALQHDVTW